MTVDKSVRDLADIRHEGRLTRDEFAVAMHLINTKLAGQEVPSSLPTSLIPPSLRDEYGAGSQEVSSGQGASSTTKDLFDLFDDPPAAAPSPPAAVRQPATHQQQPTPFQSAAFLPQPPSRRMTAQTTGQRQMSPPTSGQQPQMGFGQAAFRESQPFGRTYFQQLLPPLDLLPLAISSAMTLPNQHQHPRRTIPPSSATNGINSPTPHVLTPIWATLVQNWKSPLRRSQARS